MRDTPLDFQEYLDWQYGKEYFELPRARKKAAYGIKNEKRLIAVLEYEPKRVLDVGCGFGFLVKKMRKAGIEAYGIDISKYAGDEIPEWFTQADAYDIPFPDNYFDVVTAMDFFEHLPEEQIDRVYSEMRRVGNRVIAEISYVDSRYTNEHLTIMDKDWWQKKLPGCEIL